MASESIYQFGEVVLVPFSFSNQAARKKRPAVVVSSAVYRTNPADLLIMAITSQAHTTLDFAFPVVDWHAAGLLKPSFAKPVLTALEQILVIRRMCYLSLGDQHSLRQMLTQIFG